MAPGAPIITTRLNPGNVVLLAVMAAAALAVLALEGYLGRVDLAFAGFGLLVLAGATVAALRFLSRRRFVALVLVAGTFGLATQAVGTGVGAWHYTNAARTYLFVAFAFAFGALFIAGTTAVLVNWVLPSRLHRPTLGVLVLLVLAGVLVVGSTGHGWSAAFNVYYAALALFALLMCGLCRTQTVLALVLASAGFGAIAETLGARSGLWVFTGTPRGWLPPFWLVVVSWPFEGILHYGLSALLVRERPDPPLLRRHEARLFQLQPEHPMSVGRGRARVAIARAAAPAEADKRALLDDALARSGFFEVLEAAWRASGKARDQFLVAVKPNFMFMYSRRDRSTFTDPELVEHLCDRLAALGFTQLAVVEAQSCYGNEFENRSVRSVAAYVGYTARNYRIVDLTEERLPHRFAGPLGQHWVGRTWKDADFRISFAKNKTHTWAAYTLTLKNIYGALPLQDKLLEYHTRREIYAPTIDLLQAFPVHFGLIDAVVSADGPFGIFADRTPVETATVLAGQSLLCVDWVGASLMGLDPMCSRYMQLAVQAFGRPEPEVDGDARPYPDWRNVPEAIMSGVDAMEELYGFTNLAFHLMDEMDAHFPRRAHGPLYRLVRAVLLPLRRRIFVDPIINAGEHVPVRPHHAQDPG